MKNHIATVNFFLTVAVSLHAMEPNLPVPEREALEYLTFMDMGEGKRFIEINNIQVMLSGNGNKSFNRAFANGPFTIQDIQEVKKAANGKPLSWWIKDEDREGKDILTRAGFSKLSSEWMMSLNLDSLQGTPPSDIIYEARLAFTDRLTEITYELNDDDQFLENWINTSAKGFGIAVDEVREFIHYVLANAGSSYGLCIVFLRKGNDALPIS